jgi:hypothetical protein
MTTRYKAVRRDAMNLLDRQSSAAARVSAMYCASGLDGAARHVARRFILMARLYDELLMNDEPPPVERCWYCGEAFEDHHVRYGANLAKPMHKACYEDHGN